MPKYYVTDEIGNKYEAMSKTEILQSIGAGGERENVFTGEVLYNTELVNYMYTGEKPTDDIILKLLETGVNPEKNKLTSLEISTIVNLKDFTIHYYYTDGELYVSNRNDKSIVFYKAGIGVMTLYPRRRNLEYYVKSNKKINNIVWCTKQEFDNIVKQKDITYIVEDEEYTPNIILLMTYNTNTGAFTPEFDVLKLDPNKIEKYKLKIYNSGSDGSYNCEFLPLEEYVKFSDGWYRYRFRNFTFNILIEIINDTYTIKDVS